MVCAQRINGRKFRPVILFLGLAILSACATTTVIPPELGDRVDRKVLFAKMKDNPEAYRGRLVVIGGVVLSAKRMKEGTQVEVLQLPLNCSLEPAAQLTESEGRFLARRTEFLDPATLPRGSYITVVGEVVGVTTLPLDEITYTYPVVEIKAVTVWQKGWREGFFYPYFWIHLGTYW